MFLLADVTITGTGMVLDQLPQYLGYIMMYGGAVGLIIYVFCKSLPSLKSFLRKKFLIVSNPPFQKKTIKAKTSKLSLFKNAATGHVGKMQIDRCVVDNSEGAFGEANLVDNEGAISDAKLLDNEVKGAGHNPTIMDSEDEFRIHNGGGIAMSGLVFKGKSLKITDSQNIAMTGMVFDGRKDAKDADD
jgi:hypothetical protein